MEGIVKAGGPAGKPFFDHKIAFAELCLQQLCPALVLIEADAAVRAVGRIGAVAVGIGISQTKDVFVHNHSLIKINIRVFLC